MKIPVNKNAPVYSRLTIEIYAPLPKVWDVLTTIEEWPAWQSDVKEARLNGPVEEGTAFVWKAGGLTFHSMIHTHEPGRQFGWTGKTLGANAIHNWTFSETDEGTLVEVEECLQGFLPSLFKKSFQKTLDSGMAKNLAELKNAAE